MAQAFRSNRYEEADAANARQAGDYINCPLNKAEYEGFVKALLEAETIPLTDLEKTEKEKFFSACQPVEQIAKTGPESLRFGPFKPVGLVDPRTGQQPWAVVQLRQDNLVGNLFNLVGCQTNLRHGEQERVFRLIPALAGARFVRLGQYHRNTYLDSPRLLDGCLRFRERPRCLVAGQISGAEGYTEAIATGLLAGLNCTRILEGKDPVSPPPESMLGALIHYITAPEHARLTPMNANFGLWQGDFANIHNPERRRKTLIQRARKTFREFCETLNFNRLADQD